MDNRDQNQNKPTECYSTESTMQFESKFTFWTGLKVILILVAAQITALIVAGIIVVVAGMALGFDPDKGEAIVMGITLILGFPLSVWIILRRWSLESTAWNWYARFWILLPISYVMLKSITYLVTALMELLPNYEIILAQYADSNVGMNRVMLLVAGGIIGPICEEIIFRGIILKGFLKTYDYKKAILLSAIIFSIIHMVPLLMIETFFAGIILGYIYYKTRSLWLVTILHIGNNIIAFSDGTEILHEEEIMREWFNSDLLFFGSVVFSLLLVYIGYILFEKFGDPILEGETIL